MFLALVEYFVVLFGMRYDKHWRHKKRDLDGGASVFNRPLPSLFGSNKVHASGSNVAAATGTGNANSVGVNCKSSNSLSHWA